MIQPLQSSYVTSVDLERFDRNVLTAAERHQILVEWNQTQAEYPKDKCIHQLFEEQVERSPDAIAVVFEEEQLTYRELNARANQLAHYLQALGVEPEVLVGICVERSIEMVVGILGILKAGGVYVPLDPSYPDERLAFMLKDSAASVLLTQSELAEGLCVHPATVVCLDKDWKNIDQQSQEKIIQDVKADNLAYVIYTSGSTGNPKGVMIPHRAIVNHMVWMQFTFPLNKEDKVLQKTPFSFDAAIWEFYAPLLVGAQLVIARPGGHRDSIYLVEAIVQHQITTLQLVPSALRMLLESDRLENCQSLKRVFCGGETLPVQLADRLLETLNVELINLYGPTEATIDAAYCIYHSIESLTVPLGHPIANTQLYILDRHLQPVTIGVSGELHIGGEGLARGYLNRPDLTQEKFIPNPFSSESGARLYRTGDLARYLPDGNIEFLGRIDHQVKLRGFRIELGEIEAALSHYSDVQQAVVVAREDVLGDKRLVAYYVTEQASGSSQDLREFLQQRLPQYMIPNAFVRLDALPLTPNGKVDRCALPALEKARAELKNSFVAPRTPIEIALAAVWAEVLRLDQVSIHDEFLELGGDSLLAVQIINRVIDTLKVELSIASLFTASTIAELAKQIEVDRQDQSFLAPSIQIVAKDQPLPLSYAQERLWFLAQLEPSLPVYNEPFTIRFPGAININALEEAINEIIRRHESLRTRFIAVEGQPFQIIDPPPPFYLRVVDLRQLPLEQRESEALQIATLEAKQPFDLTTDQLLRATLIQLADDDHRLFLTTHHIIMDGVSIYSVFLPELSTLYDAIIHDQPLSLADLPVQYADFAIWQQQHQEQALTHHLHYWKQQLGEELPTLQLPIDYLRSASRLFRGARQCLALSKSLTEALRALSQQEGVTLYMVLLAAFNALLYRYTEQDDIVIGTVSAGRSRPEIEKVIGFFPNTLVVRTDLSGLPSFRQLLARVREVALDAYDHEALPFEQLVEALQLERDLNHNPLFQIAFTLAPPIPPLICGWMVDQLNVHTDTAKFDLTLELDERPEGIIGRFEYNIDLFDAETIARMIGHFQTLLESIVTNPDQRISELPLLTQAERHQLLVEWNNAKTEYPQDKCIHQLFEEQVERTPDAVAVVFEDQQLTYEELNAKANQLAHYLQQLGVKPEALVGICVERSLEMIVGILGILKAGGAYVPLDPAYPPERLTFMLEDAAVSVLLTQSNLDEKFASHQANVVHLDLYWKEATSDHSENLSSRVNYSSTAYVVYTSGSTGKPKGVAVLHQAVIRLVINTNYIDLQPSDVVAFASNFSFDAATFEIWGALLNGARLVVIAKGIVLSPHDFAIQLKEQEITVLFLTTALFNLLVKEVPSAFEAVQYLLFGGEAVEPKRVKEVLSNNPPRRLLHVYGPTESTTFALWHLVQNVPAEATTIPIGRPIANTRVYILDRHLQPVPIGISGELHIGGDGLAQGYLNRPDLTQEKFIPNPFSNEPGSRLYKTGDLARYLPNGNIEFLGRIDQQVKIRGFRIELGEIEAALTQHPDVREAVVTAREDIPGDKRLVAYLTSTLMPDRLPYQSECLLELDGNIFNLCTEDLSHGGIGLVDAPTMAEHTPVCLHLLLPGANEAQWFNGIVAWSRSSATGIQLHLTPTEQTLLDQSITYLSETQGLWKTWQRTIAQSLRQYLKGKLPNYMIPSAFVLMQTLPLTPNGKIDRRALPAPDHAQNSTSDRTATPQTAIQKTLATIWSNVLAVSPIGIHDNFFELGGDSIRSIQIISRAREAGLQITPKQMFEYQTIAELAAVAGTTRSVQSEQGLISGTVPLTPIQHWFFEQNLPEVNHYNQAFLLEIHQAINANLLEQAVQQLLIHHDALRLQFVRSESGWQQVNLLPNQTVPFSVVDLSTLSEPEQAAKIEAHATNLQATLNISVGSLLQTVLFDLGVHQASRLLIVIHHLAVDGVSWRILLEDLQTAYQQLETEQPVQLPPKTTSFKTWAEQLTAYARSSISELHLADWLQLATTPVTALPLDFESQANIVASTQTVTRFLDAEETDALLKAVPRIYQTQINDVLLTALVQVLASWCNSRHILINLEGHGREDILSDVDLSRTIGWFTSIFPVLLELPETNHLGDTLASVKEQLRCVPNRGISYGLLRYLSGDTEIASSLQALPKAEVSFNYLGQFDWGAKPDDLFKLAAEPIGSEHDPQGLRAHLLDINGMVVEGRLQLEWTYSRNLHQADTIKCLAQDYVDRLRSLITHCLEAEARNLSSDSAKTLISPIPRTAPIPLSLPQYDMWQLDAYALEATPGSSAANGTLALRFTGILSEEVLEKSLNEIIRRHEILRTTFPVIDEQPVQVIISAFNLSLNRIDLQPYPVTEREAEAEKLANQDAQHHFDLTHDPAIKATLLRLSPEEHWLLVTMHHILMDRWSFNLFHQELEALYSAFLNNLPSPLPELPIQYADFAVRQQQMATKEVLANQLTYWQQKLASLHQLDFLPVHDLQDQKPQQPYSSYYLNFPTELVASTKQLSCSQRVSVFVIILTALKILLFHWSKKTDIAILATTTNRNTPALENLIGCFINDVLLRSHIDVSQTITMLLEQVSQTVSEALMNQDIPLSRICDSVDEIESLRTINISMAPSVYNQKQKLLFKPLQLSLEHELFNKQNLPLELYVDAGAETIEFGAYYCTDTFTEQTIEQFFNCYQHILSLLTQNPNMKVSESE